MRLPLLRLSVHKHVVMVAPVPVCQPESLASPSVPCAVVSQIRGLYVVGMASEFDGDGALGKVHFNAIWDGTGKDPPASACIRLIYVIARQVRVPTLSALTDRYMGWWRLASTRL